MSEKTPGPALRTGWGEFRVTDVIEDEYGQAVPVISGIPTKTGTHYIEAYLDVPDDTTSVYIGDAMNPANWRIREW